VAGHFYNLLSDSDHAQEQLAAVWLSATRKFRTAWIDEWLRADRSHSLEDAKRGLQMLQLADLFSLWLCCDCPVDKSNHSILDQSLSEMCRHLARPIRFVSPECAIRHRRPTGGSRSWRGRVAVEPYPFQNPPLSLSAAAVAVPVSRYANSAGIGVRKLAGHLRWRLLPPRSQAGSARA
jgi:hypothetical protein